MAVSDVLEDDLSGMIEQDMRISIMALRGIVRLERVKLAHLEKDAARWMREAASYRSTLADLRLKEAEMENRGERL